MKVSIRWLRELLPSLSATPDEIARRLAASGTEIESVFREGDAFDRVVVAEIEHLEPHPEATKIRVARVFDGAERHTVVVGAANAAVGQKILFAQLGAKLPNGITIEPRKIRGTLSHGMMCSDEELGLAQKSDGIRILPATAIVGTPAATALGKDDVILELGVTPNRPDLLSHFGIARELAALFRLPPPKLPAPPPAAGPSASGAVTIEISAAEKCARYVGRVIRGVKVGPSPRWVVDRLALLGQRSISNVVDATNLVLLELGHPLHAFDLRKLRGPKIVVRTARAGEAMATLDGTTRALVEDDLVIADAEVPAALAGVMGGADSEVSDGTVDVLLESAWFEPRGVRRTSKRHGLHTEASHRFERGADPAMLGPAIDRVAGLIVELAGGTLAAGTIDVVARAVPERVVSLRPERAARLLGRPVAAAEAEDVLGRLGLESVDGRPAGHLSFRIPRHRVDLEREEDLIEELARIEGYDGIPTVMPPMASAVFAGPSPTDPERAPRELLAALGFLETISLAFASQRFVEAMGVPLTEAVRVKNPLGEESAFMRPSILPALLRAVRTNQSVSREDLRLFEIGRTFTWAGSSGSLPVEDRRIGIVLRGRRHPVALGHDPKARVDVFDAKAVIEALLAEFHLRDRAEWRPVQRAHLHPRSGTEVRIFSDHGDRGVGNSPRERSEGGESPPKTAVSAVPKNPPPSLRETCVGTFGELHPDVADAFGIEGAPVFVAELELDALERLRGPRPTMMALPRFPAVDRDLSFFVDRGIAADRILAVVRGAAGERLGALRVFDVFEPKDHPKGYKSLAVTMSFRDPERTLTDVEVDAAQAKIIDALVAELSAEVRTQ